MKQLIFKIIPILLSIACGFVFLYSAYTKLFPIEPLEYALVDTGAVNWQTSTWMARLFIGFEFACAILLIFNLQLKKLTLPMTIGSLVLFSLYLVNMWREYGNTGNCGCFGSAITMTPLEGLLKNAVLLLAALLLYRFHRPFSFKYEKGVIAAIAIVALIFPFILNPIAFELPKEAMTQQTQQAINLDILYEDAVNQAPQQELRQGKHLVAFLSLTCKHCKIAAKKLRVMKELNPDLPIHFVLNGDTTALAPFFEATRATNISWSLFIGAEKFLRMTPPNLPQIFLVKDCIIEKKCNYMTVEQAEIEAWLADK
ncbi:MAG: MauE/DoxX family redox-associated membrane protein [Bacteroidia bacterium]